MKNIITFLIFLIFFYDNSLFPQQKFRDYIFMVDVSGSMIGKGDGKGVNIFNDVKKWIKDFISKTNEGEIIIIFPFERGLITEQGKYFKRVIRTIDDKNEAIDFVDRLEANGQSTWLTDSYETLTKNLGKTLNELVNNYNRFEREQIVLIYTDGKGNGPSDTNIDNFIKKYKFIKNDYENLLTKYIVIGDINVQINEQDRIKLEREGINTEIISRNRVKDIVNLNIKPNFLLCYNYNPKVIFQIDNISQSIKKENIGLKIIFDSSIPCLFDYNPKNITLGDKNLYEIEINLVQSEQCQRYLIDNNIIKVEGKLIFQPTSENIAFNPSSVIQLYYLFEPLNLSIYPLSEIIKTNEEDIKLGFVIKNNKLLKNEYEVNLTGRLSSKPELEFSFNPEKIKLSKETDTIFVSIVKDNKVDSILENISKEYLDTLELNIRFAENYPNVKLNNSTIKYPISFLPVERPILLYILIFLILLLILLYVLCKLRTAKFPKSSKLILADGRLLGYLRGKFCKTYLTLGNTAKDDLKISIPGLNESYLKISPHISSTLKIQSINPKIKMKSTDGLVSDSILLSIGSNFFLIYDSNEIEIFYQK